MTKLIVGLGNPGEAYERTPHNLGYRVLDCWAQRRRWQLKERTAESLVARGKFHDAELVLAKPLTFMNRSGVAVKQLLARFEVGLENLIVVLDDLDLPFGQLRIRERGGAGTHNGLRSIVAELGTEEFIRIRLGIFRGGPIADLANYVLTPFSKSEAERAAALVECGAEAIEILVSEGPRAAMNRFNTAANQVQE